MKRNGRPRKLIQQEVFVGFFVTWEQIFLIGKTSRETCRYVGEDTARAEVLDAEGVRIHDLSLMAIDFERQHRAGAEIFHPVPGPVLKDIGLGGRKFPVRFCMACSKMLEAPVVAEQPDPDGHIVVARRLRYLAREACGPAIHPVH